MFRRWICSADNAGIWWIACILLPNYLRVSYDLFKLPLHRRGSEEYLGVLSVLNERQVSDVVWFSI